MKDLFAVRPSYSERIVTGDDFHVEYQDQKFQYFLKPKNTEDIQELARLIQECRGEGQTGIITSPQEKAQLNAQGYATALEIPLDEIQVDPNLIYDGTAIAGDHQRPTLKTLRAAFKKAEEFETAVIVTHLPVIQSLEGYLTQYQGFKAAPKRRSRRIDQGQALHFRTHQKNQRTYHLAPEPDSVTRLVLPDRTPSYKPPKTRPRTSSVIPRSTIRISHETQTVGAPN